jgi:molybdopterin molybdotransferase
MRPFTSTIALDEAQRRVLDAAVPIERIERIPLRLADGRVLADRVVATLDIPPFDRSAMDGYAVRAGDTAGSTGTSPRTLRLVGRAYTAEPFEGTLGAAECVEIATGAPLPDGADAVIMVEETGRPGTREWPSPAWLDSSNTVLTLAEVRTGQHVVRRGADMRAGDPVLERGDVMSPSRAGAVAALGQDTVAVFARPLVAVLPTGNEVVPPGGALPRASVYDVNSYTLSAIVERHGGVAAPFPSVPDSLDAIRDALDAANAIPLDGSRTARSADIVVLAGGSSVGARDLIIDVLRERGEILFHGIAVKPGKPTALARLGSQLVLGMPGNPTSCLSNAHVLLVPALRRIARLPAHQPRRARARLSRDVTSPRGRLQLLPVRLREDRAEPVFKGSGEITSLSAADGYVEIPAEVETMPCGSDVDVILY